MQSFTPGRPILAATMDLTSRIFREFQYRGGVSDVSTPVSEVFTMRQGVCQDFAHLEIACLRSLGLAARYVSGYLLTRPPEGKEKLVGSDASHAWVSVFAGDAGWVDFDPTNNVIPGVEHITFAWGRDYGDVSPINGFIVGGGAHQVSRRRRRQPACRALERGDRVDGGGRFVEHEMARVVEQAHLRVRQRLRPRLVLRRRRQLVLLTPDEQRRHRQPVQVARQLRVERALAAAEHAAGRRRFLDALGDELRRSARRPADA